MTGLFSQILGFKRKEVKGSMRVFNGHNGPHRAGMGFTHICASGLSEGNLQQEVGGRSALEFLGFEERAVSMEQEESVATISEMSSKN